MPKPVIIIVDDEAIILLSMKKELQRHFGGEFSFETVLSAREGDELIELLYSRGSAVLLIICDWFMPGIKGDEFLIDVHLRHPEIKAILITGQSDPISIERAKKEANLSACIQKPWRNRDLLAAVESCIGAREAEA